MCGNQMHAKLYAWILCVKINTASSNVFWKGQNRGSQRSTWGWCPRHVGEHIQGADVEDKVAVVGWVGGRGRGRWWWWWYSVKSDEEGVFLIFFLLNCICAHLHTDLLCVRERETVKREIEIMSVFYRILANFMYL